MCRAEWLQYQYHPELILYSVTIHTSTHNIVLHVVSSKHYALLTSRQTGHSAAIRMFSLEVTSRFIARESFPEDLPNQRCILRHFQRSSKKKWCLVLIVTAAKIEALCNTQYSTPKVTATLHTLYVWSALVFHTGTRKQLLCP